MTQEDFKRKLTAIFSADVAGYSRLMGEDEAATVRTVTACREVFATLVLQYNGNVVDSPGDNLLAAFDSVVDAVQCAVAAQKEITKRNDQLPENRRMLYRIGINIGDVIQEKERIYGDGVNIAARLEGLARPGGICISKTVFDHVENKLAYAYTFMGDRTVKNIAKPVGVYQVDWNPGEKALKKPAHGKSATARRLSIVAGVVALLSLIVALAVWQFQGSRQRTAPVAENEMAEQISDKRSIAVLPFDNMSGDPDQAYFSDGMTEEIITRLSMNPAIEVIARNSTFYYKGKDIKLQQIADELRVRYIVEGSVRKAGGIVRISAQLIDAETERHLWAKTYEREFKDIFYLQDEIAQQIVAALNIKSREAEQARAWRVPTENLTAYDAALRGVSHFLHLTPKENAKAKAMLERAIELDPEYALAHVLLGYAHLMDIAFGLNPDPNPLEKISELAQKAIAFDDSLFLAHALLADVYRTSRQYEQAIAHAERALALNPNDPSVYRSMGNILNSVGRSTEAIAAIKKAMHLDPHYAVFYSTDLAGAYRNLGRYEEAIASLKEALSRNPNWTPAYFELAMNYCMLWGTTRNQDPLLLDRALEIAETHLIKADSPAYGYFLLSIIHLYKREHEKSLANAENLLAITPQSGDSYALLASIYISMGRAGDAIDMMEKAMQLNPAVPAWYLNTLATSYALSGRQAEALAAFKKVFDHNPSHADTLSARLELVLLYAGMNRESDARAEAEEILKRVPDFSVDVWGERNPSTNRPQVEQSMAVLRKAGLD